MVSLDISADCACCNKKGRGSFLLDGKGSFEPAFVLTEANTRLNLVSGLRLNDDVICTAIKHGRAEI
jgi:hypothetical protein